MKATKYLSLAALALMGTLASCQSDDDVTIARPANAVGINVTVGAMQATRSNPASTDFYEARYFNQGDQVCVSTEGQDPVIFQCQNKDDQTWAEAVPGKFLLWTQSQMTFLAYYPVTPGTSMTNFTLPADQSTEAKIALADYMTRQYMYDNEYGTDINLDLERKTARVIVRISFADQYFDDQQTVSNVCINSQYSAIAEGDGTGDVTAVTPYMQGNGGAGTTYTALVVPGYDDSSADFITLTDALNNTLTVKGFHELREGYSYTYNLTVGKNTIQVQSVTVTDWTGETLAGGQATEGSASTPLDNATTAWTAGTFAVPAGGLTYSDAITVSGDVTLVLTDGETLTLNKGISIADGATLTIQGNGTMNVNGSDNSTASTVAGTGTLLLTSGTLSAKGGNGAGVGANSHDDVSANAGGNAINGDVTVSGGTLTATGGNGGNAGDYSYMAKTAAGGAAISGSVTISAGAVVATGGNAGTLGNNCMNAVSGAGGAAIVGNATLTGGSLTKTDGTGGGSQGSGTRGAAGKAVAGTVTNNGGTVN